MIMECVALCCIVLMGEGADDNGVCCIVLMGEGADDNGVCCIVLMGEGADDNVVCLHNQFPSTIFEVVQPFS